MQIKVNGVERSFDGDPNLPLLWYLRDVLGLTGTKFGCGMALCGACTVHQDGKAVRSCIDPDECDCGQRNHHHRSHLEATGCIRCSRSGSNINVPQCGYCQSGTDHAGHFPSENKPKPTDEDIDDGMSGNICRCGTYQRIRAAIKTAAGGSA